MNIDLKKLSRLQAMLAEYEKINGTVSANIGDAINCTAGCAGTCAGTCSGVCQASCYNRCRSTYKS